jgi:hypothetical protein
VAERWSGYGEPGWEGLIDGARFVVERGLEGDHRFVHGTDLDPRTGEKEGSRATHHLSSDGRLLTCAPSSRADPSWWRVVLDSVLFTVALLQGYEALHAGAVALRGDVIAIVAATGGGKSTLVTELLGRGATLMTDDVLVIQSRAPDAPLAYPGPPLMTVPSARVPASAETILSMEGEQWIGLPAAPEPLPLKALVLLDRRSDRATGTSPASMKRVDSPLTPLLSSLMRFPRTAERERSRFVLASELAERVPLWRLRADLDAPPTTLADVLLANV